MYFSDVSGRDWLSNIHKIGLQRLRLKRDVSFIPALNVFFRNYQQKRCFRDSYIQFRFGISPIHVHRMRYKKDVVPRQLLCPLCKNEIDDESHVLFRCGAYNCYRKDVNIIPSTVQNTSSALSRVMAADDEESIIQLSRFLYRVFDMRNRAV